MAGRLPYCFAHIQGSAICSDDVQWRLCKRHHAGASGEDRIQQRWPSEILFVVADDLATTEIDISNLTKV